METALDWESAYCWLVSRHMALVEIFLTSDKAEYTRYFGQAGTYVVREVEPPVGFSLSGTMEGYGSGKAPTTKLSEGLALYVAEMVNSEGKIIHQYSIDGKIMNEPIIDTINDWIPKEPLFAVLNSVLYCSLVVSGSEYSLLFFQFTLRNFLSFKS